MSNDLDQELRAALGDLPRPRLMVGFDQRLRQRVQETREMQRQWRRRRWFLLGYGLAAAVVSLGVLSREALDLGDPWVLGVVMGLGLVAALLGGAGGVDGVRAPG